MAAALMHFIPVWKVRLERVGSIRYDREVSNPQAVADLVRGVITNEIADLDREHFVAVYLSSKNRPTGFHVVSIGTLNETPVHPREVFVPAVLTNAKSLVVAHNHPSGDPTPSRQDRDVTQRLLDAGKLIGIDLLDSLVIGQDGRYYSFREKGLIT